MKKPKLTVDEIYIYVSGNLYGMEGEETRYVFKKTMEFLRKFNLVSEEQINFEEYDLDEAKKEAEKDFKLAEDLKPPFNTKAQMDLLIEKRDKADKQS